LICQEYRIIMTYNDYKITDNYAIRIFENVDCVYIAKVNDSNSYFIGFSRDRDGHLTFIPGGCHKEFLHTICKEADDI